MALYLHSHRTSRLIDVDRPKSLPPESKGRREHSGAGDGADTTRVVSRVIVRMEVPYGLTVSFLSDK